MNQTITDKMLWHYINSLEIEGELTQEETYLLNRVSRDCEDNLPVSVTDKLKIERLFNIKIKEMKL